MAAVKSMVTVLAAAGLNSYPLEATRSVKLVPSVLPWTARVWVRVPQFAAGSFSTTRSVFRAAPRSAWIQCGNALFALSQYVSWLPSPALPGP